MKKIIITTAVVVTASVGFYINEGGSKSNLKSAIKKGVNYETMLDLGAVSGHRLDIAQADIN
ncbi:hypothetical protein [Mucilaginibacter ginkgonis]|uniref:Uncharacterized protein n=1 Tax=Mucilaginibacter ginkgonis TaxID=2682091 RepID=A0A6I4I217_9SPHI|nr:hypothetical protein [Mucilaginibacter ginkgonis]QQL50669.1 hypothetical protein GO620_004205 [Mucilaginibacter ginkgonis]